MAIYDTTYADNIVHAYSDSVHIVIKAANAMLASAITGDWDGTGYLDHFELIFSRKVQLPSDSAGIAAFAAAMTITPPDPLAALSVKGIVTPTQSNDSIWTVTINNSHPDGVFQTGWRPDITMSNFFPAGIGASPSITALDGAGPVIAKVVKQKLSNAGYMQDQMTVTFSEPIRALNTSNPAVRTLRRLETRFPVRYRKGFHAAERYPGLVAGDKRQPGGILHVQ